ncbi:MAG: hypothetical protein HND48_04045 [Chloroflexi bacterium]|nr:hypothetical protein [Chloroflexota bacterium]
MKQTITPAGSEATGSPLAFWMLYKSGSVVNAKAGVKVKYTDGTATQKIQANLVAANAGFTDFVTSDLLTSGAVKKYIVYIKHKSTSGKLTVDVVSLYLGQPGRIAAVAGGAASAAVARRVPGERQLAPNRHTLDRHTGRSASYSGLCVCTLDTLQFFGPGNPLQWKYFVRSKQTGSRSVNPTPQWGKGRYRGDRTAWSRGHGRGLEGGRPAEPE